MPLAMLARNFLLKWPLFVAGAACGASLGVVLSLAFPPQSQESYTVSSRVYLLTQTGAQSLDKQVRRDSLFVSRGLIHSSAGSTRNRYSGIGSYAPLLFTEDFQRTIADQVGVPIATIADTLEVEQVPDSPFVEVVAAAPAPELAEAIVRGVVSNLSKRVVELEEVSPSFTLLDVEIDSPRNSLNSLSALEVTVQENPSWVSSPSKSLDTVQRDLITTNTNSQSNYPLDLVSGCSSLSIGAVALNDSWTGEVASEVDSRNPIILLSISDANLPQAYDCLDLIVERLTAQVDSGDDPFLGEAEDVLFGEPFLRTSSPAFLPGREPMDRLLTNAVLGGLLGIGVAAVLSLLLISARKHLKSPLQVFRDSGVRPIAVASTYRRPSEHLSPSEDNRERLQADADSISRKIISRKSDYRRWAVVSLGEDESSAVLTGYLQNALLRYGKSACVLSVGPALEPANRSGSVEGGRRGDQDAGQSAHSGALGEIENSVRFKAEICPALAHLVDNDCFHSDQISDIVVAVTQEFDYLLVVVDWQLTVADRSLFTELMDGVIVLATYGKSSSADMRNFCDEEREMGVVSLNIVIQGVPARELHFWRNFASTEGS